MAKLERRAAMALDEAYLYFRHLEEGSVKPDLYSLINALQTVDAALTSTESLDKSTSRRAKPQISWEAWSKIRGGLYNWILRSHPGYFIVYNQNGSVIEPGQNWPREGHIEFFPKQSKRRVDVFRSCLSSLEPATEKVLRWQFANSDQNVEPSVFSSACAGSKTEEDEADGLMERLYELCQEESSRGKKRAHQKWWQIYWQVESCQNKEQKHQLRKQLLELQTVWGRPS